MGDVTSVKVRDVMKTDVATLSPDDTVDSALALFEEARISGAPVLDSIGRLVGVLSLSDVARTEHLQQGRVATQRGSYEMSEPTGEEREEELDPTEVFYVKEDYSAKALGRERIADWMTREVISVEPESSLQDACNVMVNQRIHRVFVTEGERLVGVVSSFDVVRCVARGARTRPPARS